MGKLEEELDFLRGKKLKERLAYLREQIGVEHGNLLNSWRDTLQRAKLLGDYLREAKKRLGPRSKWGRWKRETASQYGVSPRVMSQWMQISKHWEDPRIIALCNKGAEITTIQGFLNVLRGKHPKPASERSEYQIRDDDNRREFTKATKEFMRTLSPTELQALCDAQNSLIEKLYAELKSIVRLREGYDFYGEKPPRPPRGRRRRRSKVLPIDTQQAHAA